MTSYISLKRDCWPAASRWVAFFQNSSPRSCLLAHDHVERVPEHRSGRHERVELAPLAARVDAGGERGPEVAVEHTAGETPCEVPRVHARERRAQPGVNHLARELGRAATPQREQGLDAGAPIWFSR